jgi:hypothetical protein
VIPQYPGFDSSIIVPQINRVTIEGIRFVFSKLMKVWFSFRISFTANLAQSTELPLRPVQILQCPLIFCFKSSAVGGYGMAHSFVACQSAGYSNLSL